jgi:hypothetical protein
MNIERALSCDSATTLSADEVQQKKRRKAGEERLDGEAKRLKDDAKEKKKRKERENRAVQAQKFKELENVLKNDYGVMYERYGYKKLNKPNGKVMEDGKTATLSLAKMVLEQAKELALSSIQLHNTLTVRPAGQPAGPHDKPQVLDAITLANSSAQIVYQDYREGSDGKSHANVAQAQALRDRFQALQRSLALLQNE